MSTQIGWATTALTLTRTGATFEPCSNLPFGDGISCNSPQWDTELFTGDEHDAASNTEHTDFRHLSGTQGRWLSPDPYMASMDITNPQSLNRYAYVSNDPINLADPTGLWPCAFYLVEPVLRMQGRHLVWLARAAEGAARVQTALTMALVFGFRPRSLAVVATAAVVAAEA